MQSRDAGSCNPFKRRRDASSTKKVRKPFAPSLPPPLSTTLPARRHAVQVRSWSAQLHHVVLKPHPVFQSPKASSMAPRDRSRGPDLMERTSPNRPHRCGLGRRKRLIDSFPNEQKRIPKQRRPAAQDCKLDPLCVTVCASLEEASHVLRVAENRSHVIVIMTNYPRTPGRF